MLAVCAPTAVIAKSGLRPDFELDALGYTGLTFVTASKRQPVAGDGGLPHFYSLILSTPERGATIVKHTNPHPLNRKLRAIGRSRGTDRETRHLRPRDLSIWTE